MILAWSGAAPQSLFSCPYSPQKLIYIFKLLTTRSPSSTLGRSSHLQRRREHSGQHGHLPTAAQRDRPAFHPAFWLPSPPPLSDPSLDYSLLSWVSDRLLSKLLPISLLNFPPSRESRKSQGDALHDQSPVPLHISSLYVLTSCLRCAACGILVPTPAQGLNPCLPALEA